MVKMALRFVVLFLRVDSSTDKLARLKKGAWLDLKGNEKNVWNNFFFPTVNLLLLHVNTYCRRFVKMLCCSWTDSRPHWRVPWPLCSQAPSRQRRAFFLADAQDLVFYGIWESEAFAGMGIPLRREKQDFVFWR